MDFDVVDLSGVGALDPLFGARGFRHPLLFPGIFPLRAFRRSRIPLSLLALLSFGQLGLGVNPLAFGLFFPFGLRGFDFEDLL